MTLRWRLTLLYTSLMSVLLTLVVIAAMLLMERNMIHNLDNALLDTHRQLESVIAQFALQLPEIELERDSDDALPRARYQFPNDAIQIEDLSLYGHDLLTNAFSSTQSDETRQILLQNIRTLQKTTRKVVTGVQRSHPIELEDEQLEALIFSPTGKLYITQEIISPYTKKPQAYRILVTLGPMQLEPSFFSRRITMQPYVITYIGRSLDDIIATHYSLQRVFVVLSVLGIGFGGLSAYFLVGTALLPLRRVRQAAEEIGGQNLTQRVPVPQTQDEVAVLARSLNDMLGRLEASFDAQRRFTSDASHELRTPVTAISGHAGYLLRRTNPTDQQAESLRIIQTESERLTNLISSLLQLARSDSGALKLSLSPVLVDHFLQEIARELEPLATAQNSVLQVKSESFVFEGDHDRLKQVVINLVGNSLKAGADLVVLRGYQKEGDIQIAVEDTGPGISQEHLDRLFDRFYRVEDSRSRDQGGAGLGLSIAQGIVEAHGGRIWLESQLGHGTTAYVQLPVGNLPQEDDIA